MGRNILAVVLGLLAGMAANMALIQLNMSVLHPAPDGLDTQDKEQMKAYIATLPALGFIVVLVAHSAQAAVGGWVAARLAASRPELMAWIIGALTALGSVMVLSMYGGPTWMWVDVPLNLAAAWFVGSLELKRRASAA